jgi:hypothetical protein
MFVLLSAHDGYDPIEREFAELKWADKRLAIPLDTGDTEMNKYHVVHRTDFNHKSMTKEVFFDLGFGGVAFSREVAIKYASDMNQTPGIYGSYFPVPAPFAGEI